MFDIMTDSKVDNQVNEICHCKLHNRDDYVTMIIATFGEFFGKSYVNWILFSYISICICTCMCAYP